MYKTAYCAVIAALTLAAPAFAGQGHSENKAEAVDNTVIPASVRLNNVTFDLRPEATSNIEPVIAENETVFATTREVKIEEYTFKLK